MFRQVKRGKRAIEIMLLKDWSGSVFCWRLVRGYLANLESDHSVFTVVCRQLDEIARSLEAAAEKILEINGMSDLTYTEAIGLIRLCRQLEVGLDEISELAEHEGRERVREDYASNSLFCQFR